MTAPAIGWDRFVANVLPRVPMRRWGTRRRLRRHRRVLRQRRLPYHTGDVVTIDGGYHSF